MVAGLVVAGVVVETGAAVVVETGAAVVAGAAVVVAGAVVETDVVVVGAAVVVGAPAVVVDGSVVVVALGAAVSELPPQADTTNRTVTNAPTSLMHPSLPRLSPEGVGATSEPPGVDTRRRLVV